MANNINKNKLWSDSLTKKYPTTNAEGLACDNFDKWMSHNVWRNNQHTWWVLKNVPVQLDVCLIIPVNYCMIEYGVLVLTQMVQ